MDNSKTYIRIDEVGEFNFHFIAIHSINDNGIPDVDYRSVDNSNLFMSMEFFKNSMGSKFRKGEYSVLTESSKNGSITVKLEHVKKRDIPDFYITIFEDYESDELKENYKKEIRDYKLKIIVNGEE